MDVASEVQRDALGLLRLRRTRFRGTRLGRTRLVSVGKCPRRPSHLRGEEGGVLRGFRDRALGPHASRFLRAPPLPPTRARRPIHRHNARALPPPPYPPP